METGLTKGNMVSKKNKFTRETKIYMVTMLTDGNMGNIAAKAAVI
jgi:hypothetical protein